MVMTASLIFCLQSPIKAQESVLSGDLFFLATIKALNYDRNIDRSSEGRIVIGLFCIDDEQSTDFILKINQTYRDMRSNLQVKHLPIEVKVLRISKDISRGALIDRLKQEHVSAVVVSSEDSTLAPVIVAATRELGINSVGNSSEIVREGVAMGIIVNDNKLQILVNLDAVKKEGSDYSSRFLSLCKVLV